MMFKRCLAEYNLIGTGAAVALDGDLLLTYSSVDGKHFLKSDDLFRTTKEEWTVPIGSITANANLIRLKDKSLMTVVRTLSSDPKIAAIKGADFHTAFSYDDGRSFVMGGIINQKPGCYYLMNHRILRTHTGRLLIPVCYVPEEFLTEELFEKSGWSGCFYSDDEGKSWQEGNWLPAENVDQLCEPMVTQGKDDVVHMYMRTGYGYLYHSESYDDGVTWTKAEPSELRSPCAPFTISYDAHSDLFFAVWANSFPGLKHQYPRSPLCLAKSCDCVRWERICEPESDPMKGYGYPMLYFTEKEILITYYESPERKFQKADHKLILCLMDKKEIGL